jgi:hypothetical protein
MTLFLKRPLLCAAALVALLGTTGPLFAQDPLNGRSLAPTPKIAIGKNTPRVQPDEDEIVPVPGKKKKAPVAGARSLESLLQQANLQYEPVKNPKGVTYKIPVSVQGKKSIVVAYEIVLGKSEDGEETKAVVVGAFLTSFSEGQRVSPALYKAAAEFNDSILFGKALVNNFGVCFMCPFMLRTADAQTLRDHVFLAHLAGIALQKKIQPILGAEAGE